MKKLLSGICLCLLSVCFMSAQNRVWTLSGTVFVNEAGTVYLSLLDENGFRDHYKPLKRIALTIGPEELKTGKVSFRFSEIPGGAYALSAFLDKNENGKLDMNLFGPIEPWGNYCRARPAMRGPKWEELAFSVDGDITDIDLIIE
jgi:uncharacterized protein (DUF2141 family)